MRTSKRPQGRNSGTLLAVTAAIIVGGPACGSTVQYSDSARVEDSILRPNESILPGLDSQQEAVDRAAPKAKNRMGARFRKNTLPGTHTESTTYTNKTGNIPGNSTAVGDPAGLGFNGEEIFIGVDYIKDAEQEAGSLGFSTSWGDQQMQNRAIAQAINKRGGLAGRKVILVQHGYNARDFIHNPNVAAQEACVRWTEDRPVFAAITVSGYLGDKTLSSCLAQRKTPQIAQNIIVRPEAEYRRLAPYLYTASWPSMDRHARVWINRLKAQEYFAGGWDINAGVPGKEPTRVGILSTRQFYGEEFRSIIRRELDRVGIPVAAEFELSEMSEAQSAVLRFRQANVTHVITGVTGTAALFMTTAESQNYRPRYALQSNMNPELLLRNVPRHQLTGSIGVGNAPSLDVNNAQDPGPISNAEAQCRHIMENAGQNTRDRGAWRLMVSKCDGWRLLADAVDRGSLSSTQLHEGVQSMKRMDSAMTFKIEFVQGRYSGGSAVRDLVFESSCGNSACFSYADSHNHGM